jgi:hypothetical protein
MVLEKPISGGIIVFSDGEYIRFTNRIKQHFPIVLAGFIYTGSNPGK